MKRQYVNTLQEGAQAAVAVMQSSREQAGQSVQQASEATQALLGIGTRVNQITDMSVQIAAAVEQQSAVSEEINRNITRIREAADSNVVAAGQSQIAAHQVAGLAQSLHLLAEQFWQRRQA